MLQENTTNQWFWTYRNTAKLQFKRGSNKKTHQCPEINKLLISKFRVIK